ncbi:MAG: hypothetical protein K9M44_03395 [Candidatus Pacebacteria bacterium]|nr:hypothetical protein [Candidatus Paceibacterota bacterium]
MEQTLTEAKKLKAYWMKMPDKFFETIAFKELQIGDHFICLPDPGDNNGHGGFKKAHKLFKKTNEKQQPALMPVIKVLV